jgi:hypothetical protein
MSAKEPYSETDALKAGLDAADKKRGRHAPTWLTSALTEPARPPRLHPEPAGHSAEDLLRALHGPEATDDDEPDADPPAAA